MWVGTTVRPSMSRRRIEQGASGASSFSLRTLQAAPSASAFAAAAPPRRVASSTAPPSVPAQAPSLNFRFSTLTGPVQPVSRPPEAPRLPNNFFSKPMGGAVASGGPDALRMTAVIDDLTQRLRKTTEHKNQLEGQVQRINAALVAERSSAASRIQSLKAEVGAVQEAEHKLRSELAVRPAIKEVDTHKFAASVRSALEQEETNARVADAQAKVTALNKRYELLGAEVKLLESRRGAGLAAQSLSNEEVEALIVKGAEAESRLGELEDQHEVIQDSITHLEALRASHHKEAQAAEAALLKANAATAESVSDAAAAKEQVQTLLLEHGDVARKIKLMEDRLGQMGVGRPAVEVSGAVAPVGLLGQIAVSPAAQVDTLSCCATGVAYHFAHDCPVSITAAPTNAAGGAEAATQAMIAAIVADLKGKFAYDAEEHAKIGAPIAVEVGA